MNAITSDSTKPAVFLAPKPTKRRFSALGVVVFLIVGSLALVGRWQLARIAAANAPRIGSPLPVSVRVIPLVEEVVATGIRYSGVAMELQKAELSFRVQGTVDHLHKVAAPGGRMRDVHEGDTLPKGTVIARLDPDDYGRDRGQAAEKLVMAEARLLSAKANTEQARIDHRRTESLANKNSVSNSELDNARTKLKSTVATEAAASGEVASSRIGLEQAEANLKYCSLTVPFEQGTIASRSIDENERVTPNQRIFVVVDLTSIVISFNVPDTLVGRLNIGQEVEVSTDALPGQRFVGIMHKISSTADNRTRTYPIEVRVDHPQGLKPGMVATVHFRREARAHLLPLTAVAPGASPGKLVVYRIVDEAGKAVARPVAVECDDVLDNRVTIRLNSPDGLRPGDRVVATGVHRLRDGQLVQVVE